MALLGAVLTGLTRGLLGSGGSNVTIPVLVSLARQPEKAAIAGFPGIVGTGMPGHPLMPMVNI